MTTQPTPVAPPQLHHSHAFAQGMIVPAGPTLYVGGQNGTDRTGALLDGVEAQTEQAMRNVVAKLTIYLAAGVDQCQPTPQLVRYGAIAAPPLLSLLSHRHDRALSSRSRQ